MDLGFSPDLDSRLHNLIRPIYYLDISLSFKKQMNRKKASIFYASAVNYETTRKHLLKHPPKCLNCGKKMKPVKDKMAKTYTGYLWHCDCMPKHLDASIG